MSGRGPVWRAVLWIERFLPKPAAPAMTEAERTAARRRSAAMVPLIVLPAAVKPMLVHGLSPLAGAIGQYHVVLEQVVLVLAGGVLLAALAFGVKAWRDARGVR